MTSVCIVGMGLIGGSLGLSLRGIRKQGKRLYHVVGYSRSNNSLSLALKRRAIDEANNDLKGAVVEADIVVLCTPVQIMPSLVKTMLPYLKPGAIVSDAGSIKGELLRHINIILQKRKDVFFVGSHPLAGSEKSGIEHAQAHLFKKAVCVMTSPNSRIKKMWNDVGCSVVMVDAKTHDDVLALTSHFPHLLAFSLFSQFLNLRKKCSVVQKLTAGSFNDAVRVAGSEPVMWTGIFSMNRSALVRIKNEFCHQVDQLMNLRSTALTRKLALISKEKQRWQKP